MLPSTEPLGSPPEPSLSTNPIRGVESIAAVPPRAKSALREYAEAIVLALLLALVIRTFVVQAFKIPSGSMLPTLQVGDQILVSKFAYAVRLPVLGATLLTVGSPQRGDVVVFEYPVEPTKDFIKRVVGLPGDVVQIRHKHVYINGEVWDDPHAYFADGAASRSGGPRDTYGPVTVPAGQIFVMGDNRDRSYDSRFWGFVDLREVKGKAFLIYWSWNGRDRWVRWERVGEVIQ
jgi:signal peptidase I